MRPPRKLSAKSFTAAALLALAVAVPSLPAMSAAAAPSGGQSVSAQAEAKQKPAKKAKAKKAKKVFAKFNLGGTLTAVDVGAGSVTFTVRGGKEKALRGKPVTVLLGENARVLRNDGPATLADFVLNDRIRAKGTKAGDVYTAKRVKAVDPDWEAPEVPEVPAA